MTRAERRALRAHYLFHFHVRQLALPPMPGASPDDRRELLLMGMWNWLQALETGYALDGAWRASL